MSFKDSKKKILSTMNSEVMTLASEDDFAVYADDGYESVEGYTQYSQYTDDKYSMVDTNKNITMDSSQINITQEKNSQYIPFQMPRFYDGIDLSAREMTISIRCSDKLTGGTPHEYNVINVKRNSSYIRFGWLIDEAVTIKPGDYIFEIRVVGQVGDLTYAWATRPNGKINVLQGIDQDDFVEVTDRGWMTSFEVRIQNWVNEAQHYALEAFKSAAKIDVESISNDVIAKVTDNFINTTSLKNYYTKTQTDTKISDSLKPINAAINSISSLSNLQATYDNKTGKLALTDKSKSVGKNELASVTINGLANLSVTYTDVDGAGQLTFMNGSSKMFDVNIGSIDPSADWITTNITPITTDVKTLKESSNTHDTKIKALEDTSKTLTSKVSTNETAISDLKKTTADIPQLKNDVTQVTNDINIVKKNISDNKTDIDNLGKSIDTMEGEIEELKSNPAASEYDVDYSDEGVFSWIKDGETLKTFTIKGGGGGGSETTTITIERKNPETATGIFLLGDKAVIEYSWSSVDNQGDATGVGTATWKVDNTTVASSSVGQGLNKIDLTEYLKVGTNNIRLTIVDSFGTLSSKTWTISIVEFKLESTFDETLFYSDEVSFRYTPYGNINKTIHFIFDGRELDSVNTSSSGRQLSYTLPKQTHGAHLLKVYMTANVNNQDIQSPTIIKDIIWVDPDDRTPIIGCSMPEFTTKQYHATNIPYVVYDPDHNPATVKLAVDGNTVSTLSVNRTVQTWSYKSSDVGSHDLTISCRKVTKILKATVEKLDIDVEPVTANLEFDFNPTGYSNSDENRLWKDKIHTNIAMTVSDNFDWSNGGYQIDSDGNQYFCVKAGTKATINYNLFGSDPKQTGSEFKIVFKTTNVRNASTTFLSCIPVMDDKVGLEMNVHEANIYSSTSSLYFPYSEEDIIEYEFNINALDTKTEGATSIVMTYEDGVGGRPMIYNDVHRLYQYAPVPITIGSDDCDVHIYRMKAYSASLTDTDILSNFISDARDSDDMIARYERNQIYDENNSLTPESVAKACPDLRIIKIEAPHFTNDKKDFVKDTSMQCIYTNGDPVLDNWKFTNCYHAGRTTLPLIYGNIYIRIAKEIGKAEMLIRMEGYA